jgi:hypothetical protein
MFYRTSRSISDFICCCSKCDISPELIVVGVKVQAVIDPAIVNVLVHASLPFILVYRNNYLQQMDYILYK